MAGREKMSNIGGERSDDQARLGAPSSHEVLFGVRVTQDGDDWVAHCLPLDIYSQSETREGAVDAMRDAVAGWLESCMERQVLPQALEEIADPSHEAVTEWLRSVAAAVPGVAVDPEIMSGMPCIRGTRIPIGSILRIVADEGDISAAFPRIPASAGRDALMFCQALLDRLHDTAREKTA